MLRINQATFDQLRDFYEWSIHSKTVVTERALNIHINRFNHLIDTYEKKEANRHK